MSTSNQSKPNSRTLSEGIRQTFGPVDVRKLRRRGLIVAGLAAIFATGAASADWYVYDRSVEEVLKEIRDRIGDKQPRTVTAHLDELNKKLQLDQTANGQTPEMVKEPEGDEKLDKQNLTTATGVDMASRCPGGSASAGVLAEQHKICEETVKSELAMYRFSMRMFERAKENYDRLKEIEDKRRKLGTNDYADLQDNTNKLLALTALMDNDRDRYRTYMSAYEARLVHLQRASDLLSKQAISGKSGGGGGGGPGLGGDLGDLGSVGGQLAGLAGAGVLAAALRSDSIKTERECSAQAHEAGVC